MAKEKMVIDPKGGNKEEAVAAALAQIEKQFGIADGCIREIGVQTVAGVCRYVSVSAPAWNSP